MTRINYAAKERDATLAAIHTAGKMVVEDVTINLGDDGVPRTCYFIIDDAPVVTPDLLADADARILELEYENLMLKEGLFV